MLQRSIMTIPAFKKCASSAGKMRCAFNYGTKNVTRHSQKSLTQAQELEVGTNCQKSGEVKVTV